MNEQKIRGAFEIATLDLQNDIVCNLEIIPAFATFNKKEISNLKHRLDGRTKKWYNGYYVELDITTYNLSKIEFRGIRYMILIKMLQCIEDEGLKIHSKRVAIESETIPDDDYSRSSCTYSVIFFTVVDSSQVIFKRPNMSK